jgi:hypothetical protein
MVPNAQQRLVEATRYALASVASDVREGLMETTGLESIWVEGAVASVVVELPSGVDPGFAAKAIDLENLEAWLDDAGKLHVAIGPWYSARDVDQVILCVIKVLHEFTGLLGVVSDAHGHVHP